MGGFFPSSDSTPLRGGPVLRWGVLGPGEIAADFTDALHRNTDQRVVAVASRSSSRAEAFAADHGIARSYGAAAQLAADADVDIVYVAAPHPQHLPLALLAVEAGKHVLVEKPLALSAAEGHRLADASSAAGVFAGEAMWTSYLPQSAVLRQVMARGDLGDVRLATADVGWRAGEDAKPRFVDPALGGGTVLDAGVYGLWFARSAIGAVHEIHAIGSTASTGVDDQVAALLRGADGRMAAVTSTMRGTNTGLASIVGTAGTARFLDPFVFPARLVVEVGAARHEWQDDSGLLGRAGLAWQATAIARFIGDGLLDSPVHPLSQAVEVLTLIDRIRAQVIATGAA